MALLHSVPGVADLSRQLMRLTLLSSSYASSAGLVNAVSPSGSIYCPKSGALSCSHRQGPQPSLLLGGVRSIYTKRINVKEARRRYKGDEAGIDYPGFTFYPRFPDHKDPPIEPTKLFMVKRVRSLYGCPWWEKIMIRNLGLEDRRAVGIFKNTPSMNKKLYRIKHLIEITPIKTPYGLPDKPENGFLKENGEFVSYNPLKLHGEDANLEEGVKQLLERHEKNIGGETLKQRLLLRWYSRYDVI